MKQNKIKLLWEYSRDAVNYYLLILLGSLLATVLNACIPRIFSFTIDQVLIDGGIAFLKTHLWLLALAVILIALGNGVSTYIYRVYTAKVGEQFAKRLRDSLFVHVQRLPMKWHSMNSTGDIIQRCTADVETIRTFMMTQVLEVFRTIFLIIVSLIMMFSMNVKLTLISLAFMPVIISYSGIFYHLIAKNFNAADEAEGELSTVVQENATGVRVVRAFGREQFEIQRFDEKNTIFADLWIKLGTISGLYWGIGDLIAGLQVMCIIIFGVIEAVNGRISTGEFIAFASYNTTLVWPIRSMGRVLSEMSKTGVSFDRVNYILHAEEEDETDGIIPDSAEIAFHDVSFFYEKDSYVLKHLSFSIPEGQTFSILGGTGSGKSTLVHLLERLYELEEGSITIGGVDIRKISRKWLRSQIGMVLQEPFLFSRTIRENIASARPDATFEEIREAARIAYIDDAIMAFPDGYDTMVGERGVTLSVGQRQRIAIARMLLSGKKIMIFDDSLSAVDTQTDHEIRRRLRAKMKDATVILISHRITTLMEARRILVLNHGTMEELGTHQELIEKNGTYRKIYEIQMNRDDKLLLEDL